MSKPDYDDLEVEARWCAEQREVVVRYLRSQKAEHGEIGSWPAWHIAPHVAVWVTESTRWPGRIGFWVITGDLPTDYISSDDIEPPQHPRKAVRAIAECWLRAAGAWGEGREVEGFRIAGCDSHAELAPLLRSRAELLIEWASDDSLWEES